jgi:oligogalacturonide transporter
MDNNTQNTRRVYTPKKITIFRSLGYAMSDSLGGATGTLTGTYLMFFLTTFGGLTPAEVAIIFAFAKFADMAMVLLVGGISDNLFKTKIGRKFGRRHLPMLLAATMILVFFPALFFVVPGNFFYYLLAYFLVDLASTIQGIAYETLATEMTRDYTSRVKLTSTRMFISAFSTFAITALPAILLKFLGEDTAIAYTISGIVFGIFFFISLLITYFTTWERSPEEIAIEADKKEGAPKEPFSTIAKNTVTDYVKILKTRAVRNVVVVYFLSYFAKDCYGTAFLYFVVSVLGLDQVTGQSVLSLSFIGMFVVVIAGFVMAKKGPKILWSISYSTILLVLAVYGFLYLTGADIGGTKGIVILFILGSFWQIGRQLLEFTPWQVIPFVPDVDQLVCMKSRVGTFASIQTFTRKVTGALGTVLIGFVLSSAGYIPKQAEQTLEVRNAIAVVFLLFPAILISICLFIISRFNLNQKTHQVIKDEIARLSAGGSKDDVTPEVKAIVEDLSGYKYENIWDERN